MSPPIAEDLTGLERIVDSTPQLKIRFTRPTAERKRDDVVELQATGLCAAALTANEGAASLVARPHGPTNMRWYMPPEFIGALAAGTRHRSRSSDRAGFRALRLLQQHSQGTVHDGGRISVGNHMPQQVARPLELLVRVLANRHSD
jgi:hypothetical protein